MTRAKRLNANELTNLNEAYDRRKKVVLLGRYEEYIATKFRKSSIHKLLREYLHMLADPRFNEYRSNDSIQDSFVLLYTLIVKHFTSIALPPVDEPEQLIAISHALYDLGVLDELFGEGEEAFDRQELLRLSDELTEAIKALAAMSPQSKSAEERDSDENDSDQR